VKRIAGTCTELCVYICQLLLFIQDFLFPMQKQCYVVPSTITKSTEIQWALTLVVLY
jgi:hypothetical protein